MAAQLRCNHCAIAVQPLRKKSNRFAIALYTYRFSVLNQPYPNPYLTHSAHTNTATRSTLLHSPQPSPLPHFLSTHQHGHRTRHTSHTYHHLRHHHSSLPHFVFHFSLFLPFLCLYFTPTLPLPYFHSTHQHSHRTSLGWQRGAPPAL
jgi:hypothetical protein